MPRIRLKISNHTVWQKRDLRAVIAGAIKEEGEDRPYHVVVKPARQQRGCSGRAWIGGSTITLFVPNLNETKPAELPPDIVADIARVTLHELEHCRGVDHHEMCDSYKRHGEARGGGMPVPWVEGLKVLRKTVKKEGIVEKVSSRVEDLREAVSKWERKLSLAKTKLSKYKAALARAEDRHAMVVANPPAATERKKREPIAAPAPSKEGNIVWKISKAAYEFAGLDDGPNKYDVFEVRSYHKVGRGGFFFVESSVGVGELVIDDLEWYTDGGRDADYGESKPTASMRQAMDAIKVAIRATKTPVTPA